MEKTNKKRIIYLDILNIIAIIAVVAMHQNGIVHENPNIRAWNTSLLVDCICYFAVPVFIMNTGATLMDYRKKYDTKTFFQKRLKKVLIPFIFWACVMFIWRIFILKTLEIHGIVDLCNAFFFSKEEDTYYFLFIIIGLYLIMPLLSCLTKEEYRKTLWYMFFLYIIIDGFVPNILSLYKIYWNGVITSNLGSLVIFVILGYLLSTEDLKKRDKIIIHIGAVLGLIYRYVITFYLSKKTGMVNKLTWGYTSWNSILLAMSVFIIFKDLFENKIKVSDNVAKALSVISGCSFGIYLTHKIVLYYEVELLSINIYTWQWRTVGVFLTYVITLTFVYIFKKIPVLKNIVP